MNQRELEIQELPFPRGVLEAPQVETVRKAYKALGKDPARYRGSAEALLRRIVAGKGFPQINVVVDVINLVSVESRLPVGLYDLAHVVRSEEHTSELQSLTNLVCRLLLEKKKYKIKQKH